MTLKQSRPAPDQTVAPGDRLIWKLGTVDAGAFAQLFDLDLQATAQAKAGTRLGVAALVGAADRPLDDQDPAASMVISVADAAANLVVDSNLVGVPFTTGSPVEFTVEVKNLGTVTAAACTLKITLPAKTAFSGSDPAPIDSGERVITWQIGDIAPAESRSVSVKVTLDDMLRAAAYGFAPSLGGLNFKFDATSATRVFDPANGHVEIERYPEPAGSNVTVSLNVTGTANPGELLIGKDATVEVIYGNFGNAPASKAKVALNLPKGLDLESAIPAAARSSASDPGGASISSWELGDLRVGESGIIKSHIHVTSIGPDGSLVSAAISAEGNDVPSGEKTVYSLQFAANSNAQVASALRPPPGPVGGHAMRWIFAIVVAALAATTALIIRTMRKRNPIP